MNILNAQTSVYFNVELNELLSIDRLRSRRDIKSCITYATYTMRVKIERS